MLIDPKKFPRKLGASNKRLRFFFFFFNLNNLEELGATKNPGWINLFIKIMSNL